MKKLITLFAVLFIFSFVINVISQEEEIASPKARAEKKNIYISEDQRIYVSGKTPLYLWMSTSPDSNTASYLLINEASRLKFEQNGGNITPQPFFLEGHGRHSVVHPSSANWKNKSLSETVKLEPERVFLFHSDEVEPSTKIEFSQAKKIKARNTTIYGSAIDLTLKSVDKNSGVKNIYYSVNNSEFNLYANPINIKEEAAHNLKYYSVDNVGNVEKTKQIDFSLDLSAPKTEAFIKNIHKDNILSPSARYELKCSDNLSGVSKIHYKIASKENILEGTYRGKPISLNLLKDGEYKLVYFAEDKVGNIETANEFPFYLDKEPPDVQISIEGSQYRANNKLFTSVNSRIKLSAIDNKSNVQKIGYSTGGSEILNYTEPFALQEKSGLHNITYFAVDSVGNKSKKKNLTLNLDISPPNSEYHFVGPEFQVRQTSYITSKTQLVISAKDGQSGVNKIEYKLDNNEVCQYSGAVQIDSHGDHKIIYYSTDNVINKEENKTIEFFVDNESPEIFAHFSISSSKTVEPVKIGDELEIYPPHTMLYLGSTDNSSGVKKIMYSINNGPKKEYKALLPFNKTGEYVVDIQAIDQVGNICDKKLHFMIKSVPKYKKIMADLLKQFDERRKI